MRCMFPCAYCGSVQQVSASPSESVICSNCNTRQTVPKTAVVVNAPLPASDSPTPPLGTASAQRINTTQPADSFPHYPLITFAGWILIVAGPLMMLLGLIAVFAQERENAPATLFGCFSIIVSGLVTMGLGQLFHCIRDIARNSNRSTK